MSACFSNCFIILFFFVGLISCNSDYNRLNERFKLSTKRAEFSADEDSVIIMTEGESWRISDVDINGNCLYADLEENEEGSEQIEGEWFTIKKSGQDKLIVKVFENNTKNNREMVITLESGNYFDCIDVVQKGKVEK